MRTFNFGGKTVELTMKQMREIHYAYMYEDMLEEINKSDLVSMFSDYEEQYTDDDKKELAKMIVEYMDDAITWSEIKEYVAEAIADYDEKFAECEVD